MLSALTLQIVDAGNEQRDCIGEKAPRVDTTAVSSSRMSNKAGKKDRDPPPYYI